MEFFINVIRHHVYTKISLGTTGSESSQFFIPHHPTSVIHPSGNLPSSKHGCNVYLLLRDTKLITSAPCGTRYQIPLSRLPHFDNLGDSGIRAVWIKGLGIAMEFVAWWTLNSVRTFIETLAEFVFLIKLSISTEFFLSTDRWNRVHSELICVKYQNYCHKYLEFVKCYKSLESFKSVPHRLEHSGDISTVLNPHFYWFWIEFFDFYRMTGWSYLYLNFTCGNQF